RPHMADKMFHLGVNNDLGRPGLALALLQVCLHDRLQIVDVEHKSVFDLADPGIDIPRDGDVDEEDRTLPSCFQDARGLRMPDDVIRRTGRADHNIGRWQYVVECFKADGAAPELAGYQFSVAGGSAGHYKMVVARFHQVSGGQLRHLTRTDKQNSFAGQRAKYL